MPGLGDRIWGLFNGRSGAPAPPMTDFQRSTFWPDANLPPGSQGNPWSPGVMPNPWRIPSDPSADGSAYDPYHDGQWSPLIAPVATNPEADQIRADAYVAPYTGPLDLDDYGRETDEMRRAYLDFHRSEPSVRSAIDGKAASVASLEVTVLPEDRDSPGDNAASEFLKWTVEKSIGWDRLILNIIRPALILGNSVNEKVLRGIDDSPKWRGMWGIRHIKNRDTSKLELRLDGYRNVLGVVNTVRGIRTYSPGKIILFTHADLFDNPFGQSDLRAAYRAANQIQDAYRLWYIALKMAGQGLLVGHTTAQKRLELEKALKTAIASGWIALTDEKDKIDLLNLASAAGFDAFEKKVRILREDIFLAVRGAYTPFMQSNTGGGEATGDSKVSKNTGSDPVEYMLAKAVGRCITQQLVPDLVRPNFGPNVGMPTVILGGVNWGEMKQRTEVLKSASKDLGLDLSKAWVYTVLEIPPTDPNKPDDILPGTPPPPKPGQQPGMPGATSPSGPLALPEQSSEPSPGGPPPTPFSSGHVGQLKDLIAANQHGHYPGDTHTQFGMGIPEFANAAKAQRRQVTRDGEPVWVWTLRPPSDNAPTPAEPGTLPLMAPETFSATTVERPFEEIIAELEQQPHERTFEQIMAELETSA